MDPIPAPGAVPAVGGIDKAETVLKPTDTTAVPAVGKALEKPAEETPLEEKPADVKPVEEKKDEPASATEAPAVPAAEPAKLDEPPALAPPADASAPDASVADAPKPASVEEVPDKEGPTATAGVEEPFAQKPAKAPVAEDEPLKEPIIDKPGAVNGAATQDAKMTGALNEAEPSGAGEREVAPQAIPPEAKTGDKRKADDLETANGTNGTVEEKPDHEEKPAEKKVKTGRPGRPGRPPTNGATKGSAKKDSPKEKKSLGHKVAKNVKKVLPPVGRTARKTRSQGPA